MGEAQSKEPEYRVEDALSGTPRLSALERAVLQVEIALQIMRPEYGAFSPPPHIGRIATATAMLDRMEALQGTAVSLTGNPDADQS